jgi:2-polyprenyl-3-methyl-5-hydroxy-6-metoxy-1,4-benzoquinol methylase
VGGAHTRAASDERTYAFDTSLAIQHERLRALETTLDPGTIDVLEAVGVQPGWRCLEVGAGGGSIAAWLCTRVVPDGSVVATDLDTRHVSELSHENLEVWTHDVRSDDLPEREFDLVHLRLVLAWLAEPTAAARRLISALKPGGWLVAEEMDFVSVVVDPRVDPESAAVFTRVTVAQNAVLAERHGFDHAYGRRVAGDLDEAGLADVACEARASMWRGGEAGGRVWKLTFQQLRESMIATGLVSAADVAIALCDSSALSFMSQLVMAAGGRRAD